jgi:hypothetical protein
MVLLLVAIQLFQSNNIDIIVYDVQNGTKEGLDEKKLM